MAKRLDKKLTNKYNIIAAFAIITWILIHIDIFGYLKTISQYDCLNFDLYTLIKVYSSLFSTSFIISFISGTLCVIIAHIKYRHLLGWFTIGLWLSVVGFVIIFCLSKIHPGTCPYCYEGIDNKATICPHCQSRITANLA